MINNFNKDFFNKNNRLKLCSIALTGLMVASPFIVRGMVDTLNHVQNHLTLRFKAQNMIQNLMLKCSMLPLLN